MAWDGDSKNAVNTYFGKVGDIRRVFEYMVALTIDDVFRSAILATLKSSNNRALRTAYDQILDDLVAALSPRRMTVIGNFAARGGITTSVTATHSKA